MENTIEVAVKETIAMMKDYVRRPENLKQQFLTWEAVMDIAYNEDGTIKFDDEGKIIHVPSKWNKAAEFLAKQGKIKFLRKTKMASYYRFDYSIIEAE